jgi:RNA recognition motif-containing protein
MNPAFDNSGAPKTLYVGNLDHSVTEELVMVLFNQIGPVKVTKNQYLWFRIH